MNGIPRYSVNQLMGDDIHIKFGKSFSKNEFHWHDYYELIFYFDADVNCNINGTSINFKNNSLYLLTPYDFHKTQNNKTDNRIHFLNISFRKESLDSDIISKIKTACYLKEVLRDSSEFSIIKMFENDTISDDKQNKKHLLSVLINLIVSKGDSIKAGEDFSSKTTLMYKVSQYVSENFDKPIKLSDIAYEMHLAPAYFSSLFSKNAGCTFSHYLTAFRLNYSKHLLISTDKSVTQICFECGFSSFSQYLRCFKKWYGLSPLKYRKASQKKTEEVY